MREVHFHQYIRNNPKKWTSDRWGAVTENMLGDAVLLNYPKRAFVASQGFDCMDFKPRRLEMSERGTSVPLSSEAVLISTFTGRQEREVLRRALAKKRRIIHVCPQGIPHEKELTPAQQQALAEHRLLFISPQPHGSPLNKKVATWCNEYVLRQASEIWLGDISPNGMLAMMLTELNSQAQLRD